MPTGVFNADGTQGGLYHGLAGSPPALTVWVGGPKVVDEGQAEGAITPGRLLIKGTAASDVLHAGDAAENVIGISLENELQRPATEGSTTVLTDYANNAWVPFSKLVGGRFVVTLVTGETIVQGDKLVTAVGGKVRVYVAGTDEPAAIVGTYMGKAGLTTVADTRIIAELGVLG